MNCGICPGKKIAKYKCPNCHTPYCSVLCFKDHKSKDCSTQVIKVDENQTNKRTGESSYFFNFPTEDTVPLEKLKLLDQNRELKNILCNPHLRDMLVAIDNSTNPASAMQQAMLEPIFVEFADECLKVIEPAEKDN